MRRWIWLAGGVVIAGSLLALFASRLLGRPGSRSATLLSVVTSWLGAWVLWSFAGGLAARHGLLGTYDGSLFALVATSCIVFLGNWSVNAVEHRLLRWRPRPDLDMQAGS